MAAAEPIQSAYDVEQKLLFKISFIAPENIDTAFGHIDGAIRQIKDLIAKCICKTGICAECEYNKSVLLRVERMVKVQHEPAPVVDAEELEEEAGPEEEDDETYDPPERNPEEA